MICLKPAIVQPVENPAIAYIPNHEGYFFDY